MANISWSTSIQVAGGPTISITEGPIAAEATDRIEVPIAAGDADKVVDLQPGDADRIHLLSIKSSHYGDGTNITFKTNDGTADSAKIKLSGPQFYSGGAAALFEKEPKVLKFSNASTSDAQIEIFVARDATP